MIHIMLTVMDALIGILLLISGIIPNHILVASSTYLIAKGAFFAVQKDIISIIDILAGIYIIFIILDITNSIITALFAVFLIQKIFWCFSG